MSLDFLKQMHDQSVAKEGKPAHEVPAKYVTSEKRWHHTLIYEPEFCNIVFEVLSAGESLNGAAAAIGIGLKTLGRYREQFPDFDAACEAGLAASVREWEKIGKDNLGEKVFQSLVWKTLLTSKTETKDPSRVVLNIDSASNAQQVADIVASLEKAGI